MVSGSPTPAAPAPLEGEVRDTDAVRRPSVRAHRYVSTHATKILGDLEAVSVELRGFASIGGRLQAEHVRSDGTLDVAGAVTARSDAVFRGAAELRAGLSAGDLTVHGSLRCVGPMVLEGNAHVRGSLEVTGPFTARSLQFDGDLAIPGTVDSPIVQGHLRHPSRIGVLRSQHVRIVPALLSSGRTASLQVDRIEATEVEIAGVDCEYLRAERIRLGPRAHVTRLDGQIVRRHRAALVGPRSWEPLPYGITR